MPAGLSEANIILSVVIPCFNQGQYILDAISSVEACQAPVYEIVIVNDGSTDLITNNVMKYLKDKHYWVIDQENQGLACARNIGISKASGKYILPLDADNKIRPDYILKGIEILDRYPEVGVVYGKANYFGDKHGLWDVPDFDEKTLTEKLLSDNYIDACAVIRREVWEDCGGYDPNMPVNGNEDWDLWLSALENGWKFYHVSEVLFDYRVRANSMITLTAIPENRRQIIKYIVNKHISLYNERCADVIAQKDLSILSLRSELLAVLQSLQSVQGELQQVQAEVQQAQAEVQQAQGIIAAMETSKFWQLRAFWFRLKKRLRISKGWDGSKND